MDAWVPDQAEFARLVSNVTVAAIGQDPSAFAAARLELDEYNAKADAFQAQCMGLLDDIAAGFRFPLN